MVVKPTDRFLIITLFVATQTLVEILLVIVHEAVGSKQLDLLFFCLEVSLYSLKFEPLLLLFDFPLSNIFEVVI